MPPRPRRRAVLPHALILGGLLLSVVLYGTARDEATGPARPGDGMGSTAVFVLAGYYIAWLPAIWAKTARTRLADLVLPVFLALAIAYLYLIFSLALVQPAAVAMAAILQLGLLVALSLRVR